MGGSHFFIYKSCVYKYNQCSLLLAGNEGVALKKLTWIGCISLPSFPNLWTKVGNMTLKTLIT